MNPMEPVTWKKENLMVEHRRRNDLWRKKNRIEERDSYQNNAETQSTMNTEKKKVWYSINEELENRRTLELEELRVRKADDEWLKGELEELEKRREGNWDPDCEGAKSMEKTDTSPYKIVELLKNKKQPLRVQKLSKCARKRARAEEREAAPKLYHAYIKSLFTNEKSRKTKAACAIGN